ncbi:hypothetical protein SY89_03470 [Halolamina pelagica]|uniref:Uncharacterized protein n=1 Tax=Halolamina pelagica TaxID=699431 RepID=A0A0P7GUS5_9EURY|nr:hypothetical protein SY89_03470 [Halolamina pelagica]
MSSSRACANTRGRSIGPVRFEKRTRNRRLFGYELDHGGDTILETGIGSEESDIEFGSGVYRWCKATASGLPPEAVHCLQRRCSTSWGRG